jgi:L-lactate dehydrogenase complex protein LldE
MSEVVLFHTCLVNEVDPEVGMATVRLLERLGITVAVPPGQTCCGQPAHNAGFADDARAAARHTIEVLEGAPGPIVVPSGSCTDMLVHQYASLFGKESSWRDRARAVAARCRELSRFVLDALAGRPLGGRLTGRIAYHPSCHLLRGVGERTAPRALLAGIAGAELAEVAESEECCGFGGLFSVKSPLISAAMMNRKLDALEESGADRLVSCDLGCLLHLAGGLRRRGSAIKVQHLAQALDEAQS